MWRLHCVRCDSMLNTVWVLSCDRLEAVSWTLPPPWPSPAVSTASISIVTLKKKEKQQPNTNLKPNQKHVPRLILQEQVTETRPHLLLLCRCAAQQHIEQDVRQQVDCDLIVVFDDEATAFEHLAGQLMPHLKHTHTEKKHLHFWGTKKKKKLCHYDQLTLLMRYPAQVDDQSENLLPLLLRYTGFFSLDQFTSFWLLLYLQEKRRGIMIRVKEERLEGKNAEIVF